MSDDEESTGRARITLLTKPGCHLCDEARIVVRDVAAELGERVAERSILDDPALARRWSEQIPVVLVDGVQHSYWHVDAGRLRTRLREAPDRLAD